MWLIVIPNWFPPSDNQSRGKHWRASAKLSKQVAEYVTAFNAVPACPRIRDDYKPVRTVAITVHKRGPKFDPSNLAKNFLDGMKRARLIVDDSSKWLRWITPIVVGVGKEDPDQRERTEILIADAGEELEERGGKLFTLNKTDDPANRSLKASDLTRDIYAILTRAATESKSADTAGMLWDCAKALSREFPRIARQAPGGVPGADPDLFG